MAICTFVGHNALYDDDIYKRTVGAAFEVAKQNDTVEFQFFWKGKHSFSRISLVAALDAKAHFPQKEITITLVTRPNHYNQLLQELQQGDAGIPACLIDKVIAPGVGDTHRSNRNIGTGVNMIERWMLSRSTHLISSLYLALYDEENWQYEYAEKKGVTILDVCSELTMQFVRDGFASLKDGQGLVLAERQAGSTRKEIGERLGISSGAVKTIEQKAIRALRWYVITRASENRHSWKPQEPDVCSIFSLGPVTCQSLCLFGQAVRFLVETYGVNRFHIISDYCSSGYMSMLKRETKGVPHACIIGVANMPDMDEQEWGDYKAQHIPPCNRVENLNIPVSGARREELSVLAHLIEHSKFCLCNLSENMFAGDIRYYVAKSRGAVLLDIGKKHT